MDKTHVLTGLTGWENLIPTFKPAIDKHLEKTLVEQFFAYLLFTPGLGDCNSETFDLDLFLIVSHSFQVSNKDGEKNSGENLHWKFGNLKLEDWSLFFTQ